MLDTFETFTLQREGVRLHGRRGGQGEPLLLLHGHPQTHVMWHRVAPALAQRFSVVMMDLRGYGDSGRPEGGENHKHYTRRAMAADALAFMAHCGTVAFACWPTTAARAWRTGWPRTIQMQSGS